MGAMSDLSYAESIIVGCPPDTVYDMVSDMTRMGEWSPICRACWWDEGGGPRAGAWFTGRNEVPGRVWETRSQVVTAEPGREFTFEVNNGWVRWSYTSSQHNQLTSEELHPIPMTATRRRPHRPHTPAVQPSHTRRKNKEQEKEKRSKHKSTGGTQSVMQNPLPLSF